MWILLLIGLLLLMIAGLAARASLHWKLLGDNSRARMCSMASAGLSVVAFVLILTAYPQVDLNVHYPPGYHD